jgi:lipopolysaccharide transport system ATP-binding protein
VRGDADPQPATLLQLEGVTKDFPKVATGTDRLRTMMSLVFRRHDMPHFRALEGVSLAVRRGESVGIIGENGAGKSTLLKIVAGVLRPTAGRVERHGTVGALLELGSGFHPDYTGRENIYLAGALMGIPRATMRSRESEILEFADIGAFIDEPIRHYSSGMAVRLGFAVATSLHPDILITDEVLAVGDESFQQKCVQWIQGYLSGGGTLLLCSHSMFHIQSLCRKALWLHRGRPRMFGDAFDVTREYLTHHEEKRAKESPAARPAPGARVPRVEEVSVEATRDGVLDAGSGLVVRAVMSSPDGRPPVALMGIVRADGTPVFGTHSDEGGYVPTPLGGNRFQFTLRVEPLALLPGRYAIRVHSLEAEGLLMTDTVETRITVAGRSRDYGLVRLEHQWQDAPRDGRGH